MRILDQFRNWALRRIDSETNSIVTFQKFFGLPKKQGFAYYFFLVSSLLGHEGTFALLLPIFFFTAGPDMGRRVVLLWTALLFVGQFLKDMCKLPRPKSPPVLHLEDHYVNEFGFPSTHTMTSLCMSIYVAYYMYTHYNFLSLPVLCCFCAFYVASVSLSRIYMGVHSPIDIIGGLFIGGMLLMVYLVIGEQVLRFCNTPEIVLVAPLVAVLLMLVYPRDNNSWTPAFGDAARCAGVLLGATIGTFYAYCEKGVLYDPFVAESVSVGTVVRDLYIPSALLAWLLLVTRCIVGLGLMFVAKEITKTTMYKLVPVIVEFTGLARAYDPRAPNHQRYCIEIPSLLLTYTSMGFIVPIAARYILPHIALGWANIFAVDNQ